MHTIIIVLIRQDGSPVYTRMVEVRGGDEPKVVEYNKDAYVLISTGAPSCLWIYEKTNPYHVNEEP